MSKNQLLYILQELYKSYCLKIWYF